ncbi:hypothetical protein KUCAC02_017230 [Chaenocephalus aceratus]|uniref:Uncharacterized protein n=1 Tax=Chaenocephalus aceratus TaxID=36190 RepID=A0ACB9W0J6_CHAAC|nr:hypothetical protein KUCAC02_017230 [Chaenocephalus aceratus]
MTRAHAAVHVSGASQNRIYNVRLKTHLNALSQRVLGCALLPEFIPPGKPTGERIAVEYLLAQSDRGDLLGPQQDSELGTIVPDRQVEVQEEEECLDIIISDAVEILSQRPSEVDTSAPRGASPHTSSQNTRCDSRGVQGWEAVDDLAKYLVLLNRTITALSVGETDDIVRLYSKLHQMDKQPTSYSLKSKKRTLPGSWRASRKRSGSAPGQQAAERLFMTHGQAALRPDANRICECVSLRLLKEFELARNRPKDSKGKTLPIPQSMVQSYVHIKQLLEDSLVVQEKTDLVLVTINNTTVSCWLQGRQKRTARDSLLQGVQLPEKATAAEDSLPLPRELPTEPVQHGHVIIEIQEPDNREGEALIRQRRSARADSGSSAPSTHTQGHLPQAPSSAFWQYPMPPAPSPASWQYPMPPAPTPASWQYPMPPAPSPASWQYPMPPAPTPASWQYPMPPAPTPASWQYPVPPAPSPASWQFPVPAGLGHLPPAPSTASSSHTQGYLPPAPSSHTQGHLPPAPSTASSSQAPIPQHSSVDKFSVDFNRRRKWRHEKTAKEDQLLAARGEPPKKRLIKEDYHYQCKSCGQSKRKSTGHTQLKGKWYCPASGQTIAEWKGSLDKN